jgi:hypothetical protein
MSIWTPERLPSRQGASPVVIEVNLSAVSDEAEFHTVGSGVRIPILAGRSWSAWNDGMSDLQGSDGMSDRINQSTIVSCR